MDRRLTRAPRLGFVGLGWIGTMRLESVAESGRAVIAALCDSSPERLEEVGQTHNTAQRFVSYTAMLDEAERLRLDGVVIATPNALHANQAVDALEEGLAVFCQKPLALNATEARTVTESAQRADRLLGIDYSYRYTDGLTQLRRAIESGRLGEVFAVESVFHNAYGPGQAWCHDPRLSGGGALIDLGVHQIDLPLWLLGWPRVQAVRGQTYQLGQPLDRVEIDDFALAQIELETDARINVAVSWNAHIGQDCEIRLTCHGTRGGAEFRNVNGSFFDFQTTLRQGRKHETLSDESRSWLGRGIMAWVDRLATEPGYDPEAGQSVTVAEVVDTIAHAELQSAGMRP